MPTEEEVDAAVAAYLKGHKAALKARDEGGHVSHTFREGIRNALKAAEEVRANIKSEDGK